ncbi:MAG TPA: glycosyltransferase [Planctomycetota bacterium]|nr:glycosyltransferase [Planctomycetota bacterium]
MESAPNPAATSAAFQPNLTVVIPHHKGDHLVGCLRALAGQSNRNFETVVVLDATPAEPTLADADRPPHLRFVRSANAAAPRGLGFTAAANVGLAQVKTPYVLLINDDVFLDSAFVAEGLKVLEHRPAAAAVAGVLLQENRLDRIDNLGIAYEPPGHAIRIGHNRPAADLLSEGFQPWLYGPSGAAGLYRMDLLRQVAWPGGGVRSNAPGIFDERLEAYYDDIDLVLRLIHARAASWFCPRMVARHVGHATYGARSKTLVRLSARNSRLVYNTFVQPTQRLIGLPYRLPFSAAQGLLRLMQGRGFDFVKGKLDPDYKGILASRRAEWRLMQERFAGAVVRPTGAAERVAEPAARSQA